jgi:hypothetical protein
LLDIVFASFAAAAAGRLDSQQVVKRYSTSNENSLIFCGDFSVAIEPTALMLSDFSKELLGWAKAAKLAAELIGF